jgi:predicted metal-dependent HD superfamily phosphohydrolase
MLAMFESRTAPLRLPAPLEAALATAYGEPHRAYHDARHIAEVLGHYDRHCDAIGWRQPAEVYVALVFHDAIYVPGARDNEVRSAAWARSAGLPVDGDRVAALIDLTARHGAIDRASIDADAAAFVDCDMAILGAEPAAFDAYDAAIAREYSAVPPDAYRAGRRAFLEKLAAAPRIFLHDAFHARFDAAARANLARAIAAQAERTRGG